MTVAPANISIFQPGTPIAKNAVIWVDSLPGCLSYHQGLLQRTWDACEALQGAPVPPDLPTEFVHDPAVRSLVARGLADGSFLMHAKVAQWLGAANARWNATKLPPLELVLFHAETHGVALLRQLLGGERPAGIVWSGSSKMLSESMRSQDPAVMGAMAVAKHGFSRNIPMWGMCFGMQLLTYARYDAMVEFAQVPEGMNQRVLSVDPLDVIPVKSGARQRIYGPIPIELRHARHPLLTEVEKPLVLEARSQHIVFPHAKIPPEDVLAFSTRRFRAVDGDRSMAAHVVRTVELMQYGATAFGCAFHPELKPALLLALTYLPSYRNWLQEAGVDVVRSRRELAACLDPMSPQAIALAAGERIAINWVEKVLFPDYLSKR